MKKKIIYGIGKIGRDYIEKCITQGIVGLKLVDSNSQLWGSQYKGLTIHNPQNILWQEYELIVITAGHKCRCEIFEQLTTVYKIPKEKIVYWDETIILSEKEVYNLGNALLNEKINIGMIVTGREFGRKLQSNSLNDLEKFFFKGEHRIISKWMHYFEAYDRFFSRYRGKDIKILEIGVFKGGSLQMWKHYFETNQNNVQVYGIDIDSNCKLLEEENIKIFIGAQEDRGFLQKIKTEIGKVDILIDDGGHTMNQQMASFEELFDIVRDDGVYLCEDLHTSYMKQYGGEYKGDTFIEYSKNLIDCLHTQYMETDNFIGNKYSDNIKSITYYDSMAFIEKKKKTTKSICVCLK